MHTCLHICQRRCGIKGTGEEAAPAGGPAGVPHGPAVGGERPQAPPTFSPIPDLQRQRGEGEKKRKMKQTLSSLISHNTCSCSPHSYTNEDFHTKAKMASYGASSQAMSLSDSKFNSL